MAQQVPDVVFDLRGKRCQVAAFCDEAQMDNLAFTADGLPTYTAHDMTGTLVVFLVEPEPVTERPSGFRWASQL